MKKLLALLLVCLMALTIFAGCSEVTDDASSKKDKNSSKNQVSDKTASDDTTDIGDIVESEPPIDDTSSDLPSEEPEDESDYNSDEEPPYEEEVPEEEDDRTDLEKRMEKVLLGEDEELNKEAIYHEGSLVKLANVMRRAEKGETVNILFYGGANTANNGTNQIDSPYSRLVQEWWDLEFEAGSKLYIKGMSALNSVNACMRAEHDVTSLDPDIVVLDFAVEDAIGNLAKTNAVGYDNLIRKIMKQCPNAAIIGLMLPGAEQLSYNMNVKNCSSFITAANYHKEICKYYDIPVIDADTAIWDIMFDLIEVTTKTERPLMTWADLSLSNVALNDNAHMMLYGMFCYFFDKVHDKLGSIATKAPAVPTVGFQASNLYMESTFIPMNVLVEGAEQGYFCDLYTYNEDFGEYVSSLSTYGYSYSPEKIDTNGLAPYIQANRNFIAPEDASDAIIALETNPHYVTFTIPEVKSSKTTSIMIETYYDAGKNIPNAVSEYGPVTVECYNAAGVKLSSPTKVANGNYAQAIFMRKCQTFVIPTGTVKMTFKTYANGGVRYLGLCVN